MAGRVREGVSQPGLGDRLAAGPVDLAGRHPGLQAGQPGRLGAADQLVQVALALAGPAEHDRAGHVGAVAVDPGPEVERGQVAGAERPVAGVVVGLGGLLPEGDDGVEGRAVGAQPAHGQLQVDRHLPLGHALAQAGQHPLEGLAAEPGRLPHGGQLALVLDLAQLLDQRRGRHHGLAGQAGAQPLAVAPGEAGRLEAEAVPGRAHHPADGADQVAGGEHHLGPRDLGGGLVAVAAVGEEQGAVVQQQQRPVAAGEAGQVADVGRPW